MTGQPVRIDFLRTLLLLVLVLFLSSHACVAQETGGAKRAAQPAEAMTFAIDAYNGATLLEVTCGEATGTYLLDSGSSSHVLDDRFVPMLGKPVARKTVATANQPVQVDAYASPQML